MPVEIPYATGAIADPFDQQDYAYHLSMEAIRTRGPAYPPRLENRHRYPAVFDQENVPACVGHAGAAYAAMAWWDKLSDLVEFSRLGLYKWAQRKDHVPGTNYPGTTLRALCKVLTKWGGCLEKDWEWGEEHPVMWARANAWRYRFARYERLQPDQIPHAVHRFHGVLASASVHPGWSVPCEENDYFIEPQKAEGNLHAFVINGYDEDGAFYWVHNSWGAKWGDRGYAKLPMRDANFSDIWLIVPKGM